MGLVCVLGARWPRSQRARRAFAEAKQRSQRSVIRWVTRIYYLEILRVLEGTLSRWSRLHLQSLAPTSVSRRVSQAVVKIIAESLSYDENMYRPHLVWEKGRKKKCVCEWKRHKVLSKYTHTLMLEFTLSMRIRCELFCLITYLQM
jgi:hypothetical protein